MLYLYIALARAMILRARRVCKSKTDPNAKFRRRQRFKDKLHLCDFY